MALGVVSIFLVGATLLALARRGRLFERGSVVVRMSSVPWQSKHFAAFAFPRPASPARDTFPWYVSKNVSASSAWMNGVSNFPPCSFVRKNSRTARCQSISRKTSGS